MALETVSCWWVLNVVNNWRALFRAIWWSITSAKLLWKICMILVYQARSKSLRHTEYLRSSMEGTGVVGHDADDRFPELLTRVLRTQSICRSTNTETEGRWGCETCIGGSTSTCCGQLLLVFWALLFSPKYGWLYHGSFHRSRADSGSHHHFESVRPRGLHSFPVDYSLVIQLQDDTHLVRPQGTRFWLVRSNTDVPCGSLMWILRGR